MFGLADFGAGSYNRRVMPVGGGTMRRGGQSSVRSGTASTVPGHADKKSSEIAGLPGRMTLLSASFRLGVIALGCIALFACQKKDARRPNVVLITIDTLRADRLGAYGHKAARTPHLDRLAAEGLLFKRAYSQAPLTLPSHASILTGLYPPQHGARLNGSYSFRRGVPTLATLLGEEGYATGAFVSAYVLHSSFGLAEGFDVYEDRTGDAKLDIPERSAGETVGLALEWLGEQRSGPFFLWVHVFDPHYPYLPPDPFRREFAADPYDGEIAYVDSEVGRLVGHLEERGILDQTMLIVTADHGESLGEHNEQTHGMLIYDATIQVPLIIRPAVAGDDDPAARPGGRVIADVVETIDILPTVVGVLGLPLPDGSRGINLLHDPLDPRSGGYSESMYPLVFRWSPLHAWREGDWKYIHAPAPELFHTIDDPAETANRIGEQAPIHDRMSANLMAFLDEDHSRFASDEAPSAEWENLEKLGYLGGAEVDVSASEGQDWPDPKARMATYKQIMSAFDLIRLKESDHALRVLLPLLETEAENPFFRKILGRTYLQKQDLVPGIEHLRSYFELSDRDPDALYDLALALMSARQLDEAKKLLEEGLEREPRFARGWGLLALVQGMAGEYEASMAAGEKALAIEPENVELRLQLGTVCMEFERYQEAETYFARAVELSPADPKARKMLEEARWKLGIQTTESK